MIFIETVGVGQSEIEVANLVDCFCLVQIAGAGDELQGIKKGIMEVADVIIINKCDGDNKVMAEIAKTMLNNALRILKPKYQEWRAQALTCSARENSGIEDIWRQIEKFYAVMEPNGELASIRNRQNIRWMKQQIEESVIDLMANTPDIAELYKKTRVKVEGNALSPRHAVEIICQFIEKKLTGDVVQ